MANRIYAVDLGAYSVKLAVVTPSLRAATLTAVYEAPVMPGAGAEGQAAALAELVRTHGLAGDSGFACVNGAGVFTHILELPFAGVRRAELAKAVGAELEGVVPVDLEDMVYAFEPMPAALAPVSGAPLGEVKPGTRLLTYAMHKDKAQGVIDALTGAGADARGLLPPAGAAVRIVERIPEALAASATSAVAVIDVGHERTDVVVVRAGKAAYSRSLARAGRQVTDAIARAWQLEPAQAAEAKHRDGFIASSREPAQSEAWARVSATITPEIAPLARELRQTLNACRSRTGEQVGLVVLVGGGARLRGLRGYLEDELGVPCLGLAGHAHSLAGPRIDGGLVESAAATIGAAFDAAGGRPAFDLRSGDLMYKVDLSFLRTKVWSIAAAVLAVLICAGIAAYLALGKLRTAEANLAQRLQTETTAHFGGPMSVEGVLGAATGEVEAAASPLPKMTAYDIWLAINAALPAKDKVTINISSLEIDDTKVSMRGSAKTFKEIDDVFDALKTIKCFEKIDRGNTDTLADGTSSFQFTITASCM